MFLSQIFSAPINLNVQTRLISCNSHISLAHCLHLLWTTFDFCALPLMCFWVCIWGFSHAFRKVSDTSGLGATVTPEVFPQCYSVQTPSSQGISKLGIISQNDHFLLGMKHLCLVLLLFS